MRSTLGTAVRVELMARHRCLLVREMKQVKLLKLFSCHSHASIAIGLIITVTDGERGVIEREGGCATGPDPVAHDGGRPFLCDCDVRRVAPPISAPLLGKVDFLACRKPRMTIT